MAVVEIQMLQGGGCRHSAWFVHRGPLRETVELPALMAWIRHPEFGVTLFDCGYGRVLERLETWPARIYRRLLPFAIPLGEEAGDRVRSAAEDGPRRIFLSHFHPDHIGGLRGVPAVPIVHSGEGLEQLRGWPSRRQAASAFFPELLPEDFAERAVALESSTEVRLGQAWAPFDRAWDLFDDGSVLAISLPGHALGQFGLLCRTGQPEWTFLVADAIWSRENLAPGREPGWPVPFLVDDPKGFPRTIEALRLLARRRPEVALVPSHCAASIAAYREATCASA